MRLWTDVAALEKGEIENSRRRHRLSHTEETLSHQQPPEG
jgi:hypothetical protein